MSEEKVFGEIIQFIRELYKKPEGSIHLHVPVFLDNEKKYLLECIDTTYVSYVGEFVKRFEKMVIDYTGAKYAVALVNGTVALQIALQVAGVEPDDEVITQPLTFVATANAIRHANAWPVFIDVDLDTLGMSPESLNIFLRSNIVMKKEGAYNKSSGRRIKAVVPMHTFGFPCRIEEIVDICDKYEIKVVEDAAESLGSFYKGKHTGTFGLAGILSFNGNKIITTGGGGMIITQNQDIAEYARHLTTTAKVPHPWEFVHDQIGYNFRMPNVNAAIGVAQMEHLEEFKKNKRDTALRYGNFLDSLGCKFFREPENCNSNYWLDSILFKDLPIRNAFLKYSNEFQINTRPIWALMTKLAMYKNCQADKMSNSQWLEERIVNLPSGVRNFD